MLLSLGDLPARPIKHVKSVSSLKFFYIICCSTFTSGCASTINSGLFVQKWEKIGLWLVSGLWLVVDILHSGWLPMIG